MSDRRVPGRLLPEEKLPLLKPEDGCPYTEEELREQIRRSRTDPREKPLAQIWQELGREV